MNYARNDPFVVLDFSDFSINSPKCEALIRGSIGHVGVRMGRSTTRGAARVGVEVKLRAALIAALKAEWRDCARRAALELPQQFRSVLKQA